jgi:glycosyltransferase involved in cell wall biosynthesis
VVEAVSMGLPVVANSAAALPEIVRHGGLLVDASDPYAFAGAVARLADNAHVRAELARSATRRVETLDVPSAGDRAIDLVTSVGA